MVVALVVGGGVAALVVAEVVAPLVVVAALVAPLVVGVALVTVGERFAAFVVLAVVMGLAVVVRLKKTQGAGSASGLARGDAEYWKTLQNYVINCFHFCVDLNYHSNEGS